MADPTALELETLTYTLLGEARGEGVDGMSMVANVIRNRAESGLYSSSPYEVALEPSQFSTHNSKGGNQTSTRAEVPKGSPLYSQAEAIVRDVIYGDNPGDPTGGSLYYHTKDVSPTWAPKVKTSYGTITQGAHIYYPRHPVPPKDIPTGPSIVDIMAGGKLPDGKAIKSTPFSKQRGGEIQGVVFHHTAGSTLKSALAAAGKSGAQYYIDRDGQIYQYASDETRVAHIQFPGSQYRTDIDQPTAHLGNDNTLGVEIVAMDENDITPEQKEAAAALAYHLANKYAIPADMIVGHGQLQGTASNGNRRLKEGFDPAEYARGFISEGKIPPALAAIEGAMGGRATAAGWKIDNMLTTPKSSESLWQRMAGAPTMDNLMVNRMQQPSDTIAKTADPYGINDTGFGSLRGSQGALMQRALDGAFVDVLTPTIDQAIAMEGPYTPFGRSPVAYFSGDSLAARDPLGFTDRGVGSLVDWPQESAERRIYEARREQQYQVAQASMAEATRSAQMTYGAMGQDISNIMGAALPDEIDGVPRVTEEDLFGPAFAPQRLERRTAAPGEGLDDEQIAAIRAVPRSQIIVNAIRPETIGADGALRGSPNNGFVTPLSRQEEAMYRVWKAAYAPDDAGFDYDYRGAFKAGVTPDDAGHWPDTFKKPNHPTFSTDSQYADFAPALAGTWRDDVYIPAPKRMSVTLDEALTPRAILDRISADAKRRRDAEEESPTTTSAPTRSVVEDVPRETVITQDQAEVIIQDARRTELVAPQLVAPQITSDMFGPATSPQTMGRLSPTIPATFTAPRLTAAEAFGAAVAPQRMGRLEQPTVLVAPTLTRAEMFGAAIAPQNIGRISSTVPADLSAPRLTNAEAFGKPVAPQVLARPTSAPGAGLSEAQRQAIRNVVAPAAPPSIPRYVSTPPATPPKLTPIRVGTSYGIPPTPAARPAAKPVSVSGVVKDVTTRLGSVGSTLKTLGNSVQGEVRRVTGQTPTTPPLPKADPRPVAVPPAAKTSAPGAGLTKDQRNAMSALPTVALEVKPAKVSTATVTPQKPPSGKPPVVKQAEQAAQVKKQREAAAPKPAPRPAVTPVPRAAPSTVAPRRSVVQWGRTAPTVRAVGANGAIRSVVAPNGGTVTMGRNGPLNSFTQSSAWWQGQVLGNGGDSNYTNEGISGDGRYGGGGSLSGSV